MNDQFHMPQGCYFLSHSVGLQPRSCSSALESKLLQPWRENTEQVWPHWLSAIDGFRDQLALLLNTEKDLICPQVNLSSAFLKILQSQEFEPNKKTILVSESDFPSMVFVAQQMQTQGLQLKIIPAAVDPCSLNTWQEWLSDDVALVLLSHVYSNTGQQLNIPSISEIARHKNIITVVDVAQSVGIIPIDVEQWGVDFVIGSCVKWLCGGPGAGFLWVNNSRLANSQPIDVGWFSHEDPFEFDVHQFRYHPSALRFWGGTPSVAPYVIAANSIELHNAIGVEANFSHNRALSDKVISSIAQEYIVSPLASENRGGTLILNFGDKQQSVIQSIEESQVKFDCRTQGIRISPHLYNNMNDIESLLDKLP